MTFKVRRRAQTCYLTCANDCLDKS